MNDVVVHIFLAETRALFQLEALWHDAPRIAPEEQPKGTSEGSEDGPFPAIADPVPTVLLILDGYGLAEPGPGNAASLASTPNIDRLLAMPGRTSLTASGRAVGLPEGFMGNSEVGHLNIGAGRIVYQDMTKIDIAVETGDIASNPALCALMDAVAARGGRLHFAGLLSDGGVHSHIRHLEALLRTAAARHIPTVVHAFMDGRDTPPTSGAGYVRMLEPVLQESQAKLGTLIGRFYAMDRDKRWDRVQTAWNMLVHGEGSRADNAAQALEEAYAGNETDEFIKPRLLGDPQDVCLRDNDGLFFFNFRADRARELASAFHLPDFSGFERGPRPSLAGLACMTSYDAALDIPVAFPKDNVCDTLGETASKLGLRQIRIAETEKYAHVTYFLNGGREEAFPGEDRILVDSPRDVPTYDLKPEMSANEVTNRLLDALETGRYLLAVCNLANPDMVGHTGVLPAAIRALETVDDCVGRIENFITETGGRLILTADHGNVERMIDPETGKPHTAHTCNPVPLLVLDRGRSVPLKPNGKLGDIAPTLLALWGAPIPEAMTGESLLAEGPQKNL
ncbi:MAG: 2,3-bisphosphoglycerate-independent phosphoglycerate mutase [Desulfovibrionaceae bacterium]|nr:2,3-bisphosphoglycerate-independent phosphoglycerate mutase [Desulfovibrionaceae bacterium]